MEAILIDAKGISNRIYYIIPNIRHKDWLESESTNSIILKRTKGRSLRHNNTYRRYRHYKGTNRLSS